MRRVLFYADLHIHSKYSRACSKDCDLEHLAWWAQRKGVGLVGTGDFTHPAWNDHLRELLVPAESGLFRLRDEVERDVARRLPASCRRDVRFMLSVEISTIYKRGERTRKVHHLIYFPDFAAVERFNTALGRIGNLGSDGRPILGLDSRDLLEITLESSPDGYLIPAHIWTPWFSALGSKSGFDSIEDCYADLAGHIFALETGLSSDPAMNWRVSSLDRYRLVSCSDAHSPPMLGREASAFDTELTFPAVRRALETGEGYLGSREFFPEEGKYHLDGHRKCGVRLDPEETRAQDGRCPSCGKPLTVGVLHRVEALADRPDDHRPPGATDYRNLIQLPEIMGEILRVGPKSKGVTRAIDDLVGRFGPELTILEDLPVGEVEPASPLLAEAVSRLRRGDVIREAGYDGEYGVIRLFEPGELDRPKGTPVLFDVEPTAPVGEFVRPPVPAGVDELPPVADPAPPVTNPIADQPALLEVTDTPAGFLAGLDPDQRVATSVTDGPLLVVAGPGTGKTRMLTHRIAHLVADCGVPPERCLAITFTRRAAEEMRERLATLVPDRAGAIAVTTFHSLGLRLLREMPEHAGLSPAFRVADEAERAAVAGELTGSSREARRLVASLSRTATEADDFRQRYAKSLRARDLVDVDELVRLPVDLLTENPDLAERFRTRWTHVSVDEYQDVDEAQYRLLRLLVPPSGNLCTIGDPDQAIYRFRGSEVAFFLRFEADYPSARTVQLGRNYRSAPAILTVAQQAIAPGTLVRERTLTAVQRADEVPVRVHQAASAEAEADFVARTIDQLLGGSSYHSLDSGRVDAREAADAGLSFSDVAILYRTDAQARALVETLTRAGLPFQKRTHDRLADRPGVRDIARELRLADHATHTEVGDARDKPASTPQADARRISPGPPRNRGAQRSDSVGWSRGRLPSSPNSCITHRPSAADRIRSAARAVISRVPAVPDEDARAEGTTSPEELHAAVELLTPLARRCGDDVERMLGELATGVEVDTLDPRADSISLLTLHAAKGLEFPVVFLVGCEDGLLPLRLPGRDLDPDDVAEERRLFFVGITRAQSHLYLSHARQRVRPGLPQETAPSPFLEAIDAGLLERVGEEARRKPRPRQQRLF